MLTRVALVDKTGTIKFEELSRVAAALNVQVQRDLSPIWNVNAAVSAVPALAALPVGACPIFIVAKLPDGEGGVHLTEHNQPYALVLLDDSWTIAASHECLEMLVDPSGNHLQPSQAITVADGQVADAPGKFQYLVEVCDPSEDDSFAYTVDDVAVSDFYTPNFFDPAVSTGVRYSFTGQITRPRQVLQNGYISWFNPRTGEMEQLTFFGAPKIKSLGTPSGRSLREYVDNRNRPTTQISARKDTRARKAREEHARVLAAQSEASVRFYTRVPNI